MLYTSKVPLLHVSSALLFVLNLQDHLLGRCVSFAPEVPLSEQQVSRKVYAGVVLGQSNENKLILAPPRCHKQLHRRQVPIAINNVIGSSFPQLLGASLQKLSSEATGFWAAFALIKRKLLLVFFNF
ncbi:hypothetical protein F2P56_003417 [Juglans regia]|uniref:Secreted protein n=1 Tax=Juglans regia TaxID=51240 RepID=A0A834D5G6_JUGRE|nr:hypothetical protein F2P56_003417 [Juglans regia]